VTIAASSPQFLADLQGSFPVLPLPPVELFSHTDVGLLRLSLARGCSLFAAPRQRNPIDIAVFFFGYVLLRRR